MATSGQRRCRHISGMNSGCAAERFLSMTQPTGYRSREMHSMHSHVKQVSLVELTFNSFRANIIFKTVYFLYFSFLGTRELKHIFQLNPGI